MPGEPIYSSHFRIRSYEVDPGGSASLTSLACLLQETAIQHAESVQLGITHLANDNLRWVLSRFLINMQSYPQCSEGITVQTWSPGIDRLHVRREFRILDSRQQIIGSAKSLWLIVDIKKNRLALPQRIFQAKGFNQFHFETVLRDKLDKIPRSDDLNFNFKIKVQYSDLDFNQHVSHLKYMEWFTNSVPDRISKNFVIDTMQIDFLDSADSTDSIISETKRVSEDDPLFFHCLRKEIQRKPVAVAQTSWLKKL